MPPRQCLEIAPGAAELTESREQMKLPTIIKNLYKERAKLDGLIASLEHRRETGDAMREKPPKKRRGRTSMGAEERQRVAERMRRYWAARGKPAA